MRFERSTEKSDSIEFEERFKKIGATVVEHPLNFIVAGIIPEAFVVEVGLVNFDWRSLVAKHEFLEGQEAQIP